MNGSTSPNTVPFTQQSTVSNDDVVFLLALIDDLGLTRAEVVKRLCQQTHVVLRSPLRQRAVVKYRAGKGRGREST